VNICLFRKGLLAEMGLLPVLQDRPTDDLALVFLEHSYNGSRNEKNQPHTLSVEFKIHVDSFSENAKVALAESERQNRRVDGH
jgi:hypothetical protein